MRIALLSIPQINSHTFAKKKKMLKNVHYGTVYKRNIMEKTNMPTITEDGYLTWLRYQAEHYTTVKRKHLQVSSWTNFNNLLLRQQSELPSVTHLFNHQIFIEHYVDVRDKTVMKTDHPPQKNPCLPCTCISVKGDKQ